MLACGLISPEAAFSPEELALIVPPLTNILKRLPAGTVGGAAAWLDPILLCFGLTVWARRILTITKPPKVPDSMPAEDAFHTNGYDAEAAARNAAALEQARAAMGSSTS